MMTREQIERIAESCGVEVSYTEVGKGGFIVDLLLLLFYKTFCNPFKLRCMTF